MGKGQAAGSGRHAYAAAVLVVVFFGATLSDHQHVIDTRK
jgi:hypothetical protein